MDYNSGDSSKALTKSGVRGVTSTIGGVLLLILGGLGGLFGGFLGVILGVIAIAVGVSGMKSHTSADKAGGIVAIIAGAILGLSGLAHWNIPIIGALAGFASSLATIGAVGLIGYGLFSLVKFFVGLKQRS